MPISRPEEQASDHPLADLFARVARGVYPPSDGLTECMPRPPGAVGAVLGFTAHAIVAADVDAAWVAARCRPDDLAAPFSARFVMALARRLGCAPSTTRLVLWALGEAGEPILPLVPLDARAEHARVVRAHRYRRDVRVFRTDDGQAILTIGRGLAGRWEAGFEVAPGYRGRGVGRALVASSRRLVPPGEPLFMQVAVGNIASIRAILAGDFTPVGAEVLFEAVDKEGETVSHRDGR